MGAKCRKIPIDSEAIKKAIKERGITKNSLAERLNVQRATVWKAIKTGMAVPELKAHLYAVLGISDEIEQITKPFMIYGNFKGTVNGAKLEGYIEGVLMNDTE